MKQLEQLLYDGIVNEMNQSHRVQFKNLMIFRIFASIFMTYALIQVSVVAPTFSQNFLYLTLWGGYTTYFYFGLVSFENVSFYMLNKQFFDQSLWKLCHILFIVAFCFELPIMVIYWSYIFPQDNVHTINQWLVNVDVHSISCILIFVDFIINDIQFQLKQSIMLIVIAIIYLIVNMFYVLVTGIEIYPGINWRNGISYIISVITLGIMFGVFQLGLLYRRNKQTSFYFYYQFNLFINYYVYFLLMILKQNKKTIDDKQKRKTINDRLISFFLVFICLLNIINFII